MSTSATQLFLEGRELRPTQVKRLEARLRANPADHATRTRLIAFYGREAHRSPTARRKYKRQNLWFIERFPGSGVCALPIFDLPPHQHRAFYRRARELWLAHCRTFHAHIMVLSNAARFFAYIDDRKAEALLKRAEALQPRVAEWKSRLGMLFRRRAAWGPATRRMANSRTALAKLEEAARLESRRQRFYRLPWLARTAFEAGDLRKARRYATAAINEARTFDDWAQGNGIHHGHTVLGRVAAARGDLQLAAKHLRRSARMPGSPQLNSFGPSFDLAEDLLEVGDHDTVLEYLESCRAFWKYGEQALDAWEKQLRSGLRPDFHAAYRYIGGTSIGR